MNEAVLMEIAENPQSTKYSWDTNIRPAIQKGLKDFEFNDLLVYLENLNSSPFTVQRIAELLLHPNLYPIDRNKYKRALEKCLKVTSSIVPEKAEDMMEL